MVAARAGVSTATVSLVINGKTAGRVSADTIEAVQRAIAELGYVVDGIGSSLARGGSNIVILVAPDVANPFYADVIAGVRGALGDDYQLLLSVTDAGKTPEPGDIRKLFSLRPAGLLVDAPGTDFLAHLAPVSPMVLLDAPGIDSTAPSVNFDVAHGARELADHLAGLGHRRVAYLDAVTGTGTFRLRRDAFLARAVERGLKTVADAGAKVDIAASAAAFADAWPRWAPAGVTAVVCATDTHAYGVFAQARRAGLRIPDDVAVAGFDDLPYSATSTPGLTSVRLPAAALGRAAGSQLRRLMEGMPVEESRVLLPSRLMVRGSTDPSHPGRA
ncbi:LacI family DNA-binding transcriptional regulator [Specibacter cremeus]|uniref:LacI family DNA-binding transcriptional regulator n=1 Tax=Specibacter cremeus TaxID=1629051 RepID=UPI000F7927CA|nr:LacI family DNA-binding transcriptional regulator [Specibacter cremeus]